MRFTRTPAHLGLALAAMLTLLVASTAVAAAQNPFTAYGIGQSPDDLVTALVAGQTCAATTADEDGNWILSIDTAAPCSPAEGDTITFRLNGVDATETAVWTPGGTPQTSGYDPNVGITLSAGTSDETSDAPEPADTGSGGFAPASGAGTPLLMLLGALAAGVVASARLATRDR